MITKEMLLDEARRFDTYDDFIVSIQTELGVYDSEGNRLPIEFDSNIGIVDRSTLQGREKLAFIESLVPGRGWFYIAAEVWNEANNYPKKKGHYLR